MLKKLIAMFGTIMLIGFTLGIIVLVLAFFCGVVVLGLKIVLFILAFALITSFIRKILERFR